MKDFRKGARILASVAVIALVFLSGMIVEWSMERAGGTDYGCTAVISPALAQGRISEELPDVIERVVPAVVNISSKKVIQTRSSQSNPFSDPFFRRFFGDELYRRFNEPRERVHRSLGSGVIVSENGYIITNNHLVEKAEEVEVVLPDGREFDARIIGTDPRSDIAVIKIDSDDLPSVQLGDPMELRLGQTVLAIGYPYGIGQTVTMGIVSALGRTNLSIVDYENFIQTDAAINPGNSGGALINVNGELVGINTAILSRTGGNQGIGFAIPIDLAQSVMESIIDHGRVIRGWLGVVIQDVTPQLSEAFGLEEAKGTLISDVQDESPAERGGLERGDVVLSYGGRDVRGMNDFRQMVAMTEPGSEIEFEILREGKRKRLNVEIGEQPNLGEGASIEDLEDASPFFLGVGLENITDRHRRHLDLPDDVEGVVITAVEEGSPAADAGLRIGDLIRELNKIRIEDLEDFNEALGGVGGDSVLLLVYRDGSHLYMIIRQ